MHGICDGVYLLLPSLPLDFYWITRVKEVASGEEGLLRAAASTSTTDGGGLSATTMVPTDPSILYLRCNVHAGRAFIAQVRYKITGDKEVYR